MDETQDYVGTEVQIGGGFGGMKPLAQHGTVTISEGVLTLFGTQGDVIAEAPLAAVEVKKIAITMGQSVSVSLNGKKYSVSVGHGKAMGTLSMGKGGQIADSIEGTQGFIAAYEALSGKKV